MSYRSSVCTNTIGTSAELIIIDLRADASTEQAADCIASKHGQLDVLANNLFGAEHSYIYMLHYAAMAKDRSWKVNALAPNLMAFIFSHGIERPACESATNIVHLDTSIRSVLSLIHI